MELCSLCFLLWLFYRKNTYWSQAEQEYTFHLTRYVSKLNSQENILFRNKILQKRKTQVNYG